MDIVEIKIVELSGYNKNAVTTMDKLHAERLEKEGKIKIIKTLTSNKIAPQGSTKMELEKTPSVEIEKEAKGKKYGGKK